MVLNRAGRIPPTIFDPRVLVMVEAGRDRNRFTTSAMFIPLIADGASLTEAARQVGFSWTTLSLR